MVSNDKSESEFIMDFLVRLAPTLQKLIPLDCIIGIADTKKFLCSIPGEKINETSSIGHQQAAATGELSRIMEELSESANKLKLASSIVIG